jgi:4-hydroxybenzoate polyprenyltransferase
MALSSAIAAAVRIARPHLWTYTLGAAFLAALVASGNLATLAASPDLAWFALWLTVPAGWLIYGLNDAFDAEADVGNVRKRGVERSRPFGRKATLGLAALAAALYLPLAARLPWVTSAAVAVAAISTYLYSAPPLRAKGIPVLDGLLYLAPPSFAAAGYAAVTGQLLPWPALALAWAFSFAMHLFSASVDVEADRAAGIRTVSVWLGDPRRSVRSAATLCWVVAALAWGGAPAFALAAAAYATFFSAAYAASALPGFSYLRWYGAFVALHFPVGFALTVGAF